MPPVTKTNVAKSDTTSKANTNKVVRVTNTTPAKSDTLENVTKYSPKVTLAGAIARGVKESVKAKPLGNPKDAKTTAGKVGRAIGNTAIKTVTAPLETATNVIGAGISKLVKGENTQASRRQGSIYKSSPQEIAITKKSQSDTANQTKGFSYKLASKK